MESDLMDLALTTLGSGTVTVSDALITLGTVLSGLVVYRQKSKDAQIKSLLDTIEHQRDQLDRETKVNESLHDRLLTLIEKMNGKDKHDP